MCMMLSYRRWTRVCRRDRLGKVARVSGIQPKANFICRMRFRKPAPPAIDGRCAEALVAHHAWCRAVGGVLGGAGAAQGGALVGIRTRRGRGGVRGLSRL